MQAIKKVLTKHKTLPDTKYGIEYEDGKVTVKFPNGRTQKLYIGLQDDRYILTSTVLGSRQLNRRFRSPKRRAELLWRRNHETEVVTFTIDNHDRLIGLIDQVAGTMDPEEITFYVARLAQECDRLEYLLTGEDRS